MSDLRSNMSALHQQLLAIRAETGKLTPQAIVDVARNVEHPLHSRFEWDNQAAGEAYRRVQAAEIIRSVKVIYTETPEGEERTIRAFSSLYPQDAEYAPTEEIMQDEFTSKLLLRELRREVAALQRKYGHLQQFAEIVGGLTHAS